MISEGTAAQHTGDLFNFYFESFKHIEAAPGERLVVLGRRGQGKTSFLSMISGLMTGVKGSIKINGDMAYLPDDFFFLKSTVRNNIKFYNDNVSQQ